MVCSSIFAGGRFARAPSTPAEALPREGQRALSLLAVLAAPLSDGVTSPSPDDRAAALADEHVPTPRARPTPPRLSTIRRRRASPPTSKPGTRSTAISARRNSRPPTQITPDNVANLKPAWQMHTGDVSVRATSPARARPAISNTGCPPPSGRRRRCSSTTRSMSRRRSIASSPSSPTPASSNGPSIPHAELKALTQPDLKTRGVAYWQAAEPEGGRAVPEDRLCRHHGGRALGGRRRHRQGLRGLRQGRRRSTSTNGTPSTPCSRCRCCSRRPSTRTLLFVGWAGKDWAFAKTPPGIVFAFDAADRRA